MENYIGEQLNDLNACLNEIGKDLKACYSNDNLTLPKITDVVQVALQQVRKHLKSQVACLFLLNKDGYLERMGIEGIDKDKNLIIHDQWLKEEKCKPGESFSGQAVPPVGKDSGYGSPNYSNNLKTDQTMIYGAEYLDKLGALKSGISVPLNGFHRTFGSLEVFNKQGSDEFTPDDVYLLMLIGSLIANHISHYKREYRKYVDNQLTNWLFRVELEQVYLKEINTFLAKALISETTPIRFVLSEKLTIRVVLETLLEKEQVCRGKDVRVTSMLTGMRRLLLKFLRVNNRYI